MIRPRSRLDGKHGFIDRGAAKKTRTMSDKISFLTAYSSGEEMMALHLDSIRHFYPDAPILVSGTRRGAKELERHQRSFRIQYWVDDLSYIKAVKKLFGRCHTKHACIMDHDTVLLANIDHLMEGVEAGRWNLVGVEERIRDPFTDAWFRYAPGYMDMSMMLFNAQDFRRRWGWLGVRWQERPGTTQSCEYHYGICQKLTRHKYLLPYHTKKYRRRFPPGSSNERPVTRQQGLLC